MGNVEGAAQAIADALAPTQQSPSARWRWGTVASVQDDGTITAMVGGATVSGIRASQQAMGAAAGDRVRICHIGTEAFADSLRASSKLIKLPSIEADSLALGSPLTIANGGTGATTASAAKAALSVPSVESQTNQNVSFGAGTGSGQVQLIGFNVTNSSHALSGKRLVLIIRSDGLQLYNGTDGATIWNTAKATYSATAVITAASGVTLGGNYTESGGWACLTVSFSGISGTGSKTLGTIGAGHRPPHVVYDTAATTAITYIAVESGGTVRVYCNATAASSTTYWATVRYPLD